MRLQAVAPFLQSEAREALEADADYDSEVTMELEAHLQRMIETLIAADSRRSCSTQASAIILPCLAALSLGLVGHRMLPARANRRPEASDPARAESDR